MHKLGREQGRAWRDGGRGVPKKNVTPATKLPILTAATRTNGSCKDAAAGFETGTVQTLKQQQYGIDHNYRGSWTRVGLASSHKPAAAAPAFR